MPDEISSPEITLEEASADADAPTIPDDNDDERHDWTDGLPGPSDGTVDLADVSDLVEPADAVALAHTDDGQAERIRTIVSETGAQYLDRLFTPTDAQPSALYLELEDRAKAVAFVGAEISGIEQVDVQGNSTYSVGVMSYYRNEDQIQAEYGETARLHDATEAVELHLALDQAVHSSAAIPDFLLPGLADEIAANQGNELTWHTVSDEERTAYGLPVHFDPDDRPLRDDVEMMLALDTLALVGVSSDVQAVDLEAEGTDARNRRDLEEGLARLGLEIEGTDRSMPLAAIGDTARIWALTYVTPDGHAMAGLFSTGAHLDDQFAVSTEGSIKEAEQTSATLVNIAEHASVSETYAIAQAIADGTTQIEQWDREQGAMASLDTIEEVMVPDTDDRNDGLAELSTDTADDLGSNSPAPDWDFGIE